MGKITIPKIGKVIVWKNINCIPVVDRFKNGNLNPLHFSYQKAFFKWSQLPVNVVIMIIISKLIFWGGQLSFLNSLLEMMLSS